MVNTGEQEGGLLSAVRFLPAGRSHPERSEGSRYKTLVALLLLNTGRREDEEMVNCEL